MARDKDNNWHSTDYNGIPFDRSDIDEFRYSDPYTCGNAIVVISNIEDFNGTGKTKMG
jgi:hypothetical protein